VHDVADKCHEFQFSNSVDLHINKTKMIALIKSLLGLGEKVNIKELIANGATVLDVRSPAEFKDGHIKGALNFPLQNLTSQMNKLKKEQVIVTCCRSGSRSGMAKHMLKSNGFLQVHNGGPWTNLK
jgi:rhodanese-related sulfurtransferase